MTNENQIPTWTLALLIFTAYGSIMYVVRDGKRVWLLQLCICFPSKLLNIIHGNATNAHINIHFNSGKHEQSQSKMRHPNYVWIGLRDSWRCIKYMKINVQRTMHSQIFELNKSRAYLNNWSISIWITIHPRFIVSCSSLLTFFFSIASVWNIESTIQPFILHRIIIKVNFLFLFCTEKKNQSHFICLKVEDIVNHLIGWISM